MNFKLALMPLGGPGEARAGGIGDETPGRSQVSSHPLGGPEERYAPDRTPLPVQRVSQVTSREPAFKRSRASASRVAQRRKNSVTTLLLSTINSEYSTGISSTSC